LNILRGGCLRGARGGGGREGCCKIVCDEDGLACGIEGERDDDVVDGCGCASWGKCRGAHDVAVIHCCVDSRGSAIDCRNAHARHGNRVQRNTSLRDRRRGRHCWDRHRHIRLRRHGLISNLRLVIRRRSSVRRLIESVRRYLHVRSMDSRRRSHYDFPAILRSLEMHRRHSRYHSCPEERLNNRAYIRRCSRVLTAHRSCCRGIEEACCRNFWMRS
jgi:hypothetical protein